MKDVHHLLEQKEADLARVRGEIEGLRFIASMDCTAQAVQRELATWICSKCNHQYSRRAAESVDWTCEDCEIPLLDSSGQRKKGDEPYRRKPPTSSAVKNGLMPYGMRKRVGDQRRLLGNVSNAPLP